MAHNITIFANFDLKDVKDPESLYYNAPNQEISVLNQITESESLVINEFNQGYKLSITVNGIDGIGYEDKTFNLDKIYYEGQQIYFTARLKTLNDFPAKSKPRLFVDPSLSAEGSFGIELVNSDNIQVSASFFTNFGSLTSNLSGGFYNGYFIPHTTGENLKLKAVCNDGTSPVVAGFSNTFTINQSTGIYDFRKINEDNDQTQNYKEILFQPTLATNTTFFDKFLGKIVGNSESDPNSLGIKIYEKISNYVANNSDIDTCNIEQMVSQLKLIDTDVLVFAQEYPSSMSRIIDFFSIQLSKIKEVSNNYNYNFNNYGYSDNSDYGVNLGNEILLTEILSGGTKWNPVVALDKFSGEYTLLKNDPTSAYDFRFLGDPLKNHFCLSAYNIKWPWGLILPENIGNNTYFINETAADTYVRDDNIGEIVYNGDAKAIIDGNQYNTVRGTLTFETDEFVAGINDYVKFVPDVGDNTTAGYGNKPTGGTPWNPVIGKRYQVSGKFYATGSLKGFVLKTGTSGASFNIGPVVSGLSGMWHDFSFVTDAYHDSGGDNYWYYFALDTLEGNDVSISPNGDEHILIKLNPIREYYDNVSQFIVTEDMNRVTNEKYTYNINDINNYYTFYNYISTVNGKKLDYILDISNPLTNLPLTSLSSFNADDGILSDIILNNLYTKTALLS